MYSKVTREKIFNLCCNCSGFPLGVDDLHSKSDINKLLTDFYNGKKGATVTKGEQQPTSMAIIVSNFSPADQGRYTSLTTSLIFTTSVVMCIAGMLQGV